MRSSLIVSGLLVATVCVIGFLIQAQTSDPETWPVVYQENFEDPTSGWDAGETESVARAYVDGAYEIQVKDAWGIAWSLIPEGQEFLNFAAEVKVQAAEDTGEFGFLFRYLDSDNFYCFTVRTDGFYGLWLVQDDSCQTLLDSTSGVGLHPDGANRLKIVAQGSTFSFFLNGQFLSEFTDDTFRTGQIALCTGTFEEPGFTARFEELVVWEDPQVRDLADQAAALFRQAQESRAWDLQAAANGFQKVLALYQRLGWKEKEADVLLDLGDCLYLLSDYQGASARYEQSLAIFREIGDRQSEAASLGSLGICSGSLGDYRTAIDYYERSLAIFREIGDRQGEAASLNNLGSCYRALGDYSKAIDFHEQSLAIFREIRDRQGEAGSLNNLGICYDDLGDYTKAIDYYERSLAIFREIGDRQGEAASLNNLGRFYYALGDYGKAIDFYEQSLAIFREIGDRQGEAKSLNNLGICSGSLGDYRTAIDFCEQSLGIAREIKDQRGAANSLNDLGICSESLGDYRTAVDYYERSLAIFREIGDRQGEAGSLNNLGICYHTLRDYGKAIDYYEQGLEVVQAIAAAEGYVIGAPETLWRLHNDLGSSHQALGELERAAEEWKEAVAAIEAMRGRLARAGFKALFMREKYFVYERLVPTLLDVDKPEEAISYAERAKARTLVDMMETAMVLRAEILPAGLQPAGEQVRALSALEGAAGGEFPEVAPTRSGIARAVQRTQEEYETILDRLEQDHPALGETLSVNPERLWQHFQYVQGELGEGTVSLHYFVTSEETIVWAITEGGIQTVSRILVARVDLAERVRVFREVIESPPALGQEMVSYLDALARANDLYELLILPVEDYIQDAKHLVIVPSDVLFYVPFGALYRCPGCEGRELLGGQFLIERFPVSYAPSLSSLYWPFRNRGDGTYESVLSVGNPTGDLVHAEEEARAVASLFPYGDLLLREAGTKERVLALLATTRYDVVHFSTHGLFDRVLPLLSGVLFHGEEMLYAGEILGLHLPVELVVLSACQTALPPELEEGLVVGDEIHGLGQALFTAGVPSALLTLWNVNDRSTMHLMEAMYQGLMTEPAEERLPKGEALRRAQLALLGDETGIYRHPYFWAPFVLYGDWGQER